MSSLYFDETLTAAELTVGAEVTLSGAEAHHAVSVSRLRVDEPVLIGNGAGVRAATIVTATAPKSLTCTVELVERRDAPTPQLILVQSLAKGDRDERAVESSTEVGVDTILPYQAHRSISRWNQEKAERGRDRWQKLAREASKQSLRFHIPAIGHLLNLEALCELSESAILLVLEPTAKLRLTDIDAAELRNASAVALVVGPEGGFDEREIDALAAVGANFVRLGETVLRTSTAGVASLAIVNGKLGRW